MLSINRFINILTSTLRPIKLYVGGSGGSGGIYGLQNIGNLDLKINLDDLPKGHEIVKPYDNANYSSDKRQGSVNTKPQTSEIIDTTKYDARINDIQSQIDAIGYVGPTRPTYNSKHPFFSITQEEANRNKQKQEQLDRLYNQLSAAQQEKSNYYNNATKGIGYTDLDKNTTQADQALQAQQQSNQAIAQANKTANINAGINKSRAGMLGSQKASTDNSVAQNQYMANRSTAASTQADYLEKMAQADALKQYGNNMSKSAGLAALSGALTGAGSGAALGAVVSDENMKEDPIDDNKLQEAIVEFKRLSERIKQLKGERK